MLKTAGPIHFCFYRKLHFSDFGPIFVKKIRNQFSPILRKLSNFYPKYKKYNEINKYFEKLGNFAPFFHLRN